MTMKIRKGFTLIELLVVIAIIAILSTLAVVALNNARLKSRDAKRVSDIKQVQTALELYFGDKNGYPVQTVTLGATLTAGGANVSCSVGTKTCTTLSSDNGFSDTAAGTTYMGQVPNNQTPNGADYTYKATAASAYSIGFTLEGATGGLAVGANCATQDGIKGGVCL